MHTHGCILFFHTQHAILVQLTTCRPVIVKLNSGVDYRGILACLGTLRNLMFAHETQRTLQIWMWIKRHILSSCFNAAIIISFVPLATWANIPLYSRSPFLCTTLVDLLLTCRFSLPFLIFFLHKKNILFLLSNFDTITPWKMDLWTLLLSRPRSTCTGSWRLSMAMLLSVGIMCYTSAL